MTDDALPTPGDCSEFIDVGPFRFECNTEHHQHRESTFRYHGGKVTHHCLSRQDVGDVDVTFWTWLEPEDEWEQSRLDPAHPSYSGSSVQVVP